MYSNSQHQAQLMLQQAFAYYKQQQFDKALPLLQRLSKIQPLNASVWHILALTQRRLEQFQEADRSFTSAIKLAPNNHEVFNNYGNFLRQLKREHSAREMFTKSIQLKPNFIEAHYNLGLLDKAELDFDGALQRFLRVLNENPKHRHARLAAAEIYHLQGFDELSLNLLNNEFDAHSVAFYRQRALAYFALNNKNSAFQDLEKAIKLAPRQLDLHEVYSDMRWLQQEPDWLGSYQHYLEQNPDWHDLRLAFAHRLIKAQQHDEALDALQPLLSLQSVPLQVLLLMGHINRVKGQLFSAEKYLQRALNLRPEHQEALYEMFVTQLGLENYDNSDDLSKRLVTLAPKHQGWWSMRATVLKARKKWNDYRVLYNFDEFVQKFDISTTEDGRLSEFNERLLQTLERLHVQKQHPLQQSLRNGTQTDGQLFLTNDETIQELQERISAAVTEYINNLPDDERHPFLKRKCSNFKYSGSWSVRLNMSGFHRNHYHSEGWISGCFYVSVPRAVNRNGHGWIKFGQSQLDPTYHDEFDYVVKPESGTLVLFPSMMWHGTIPFDDDEYRVTVAFDIVPNNS